MEQLGAAWRRPSVTTESQIGRNGVATGLLLLAALVAPSFSFVALPPVLPDIAARFGGGDAGRGIAQLAGALPFFGLAFGGLVAGWVLERLGVGRLIALSGAGLIAASLAGLLGGSAPVLLAGCAVIGLVAALATSALAALTGAVVEESRRARLLGVQVATSDFCTLAGGAAAAALAQAMGWRGPFLIFTVFGLFLLICLAAARLPPAAAERAPGGLVRMVRLAWPTYLGAAFVFLLVSSQATQLPFYLERLGFHTAAARAVVTTFALFAAMCGSISFALLQGRLPRWAIQAASVATAAAGLAGLAAWRGDLPYGLACTFGVGIGIGLTVPTLFASALRSAPEGLRGHSIGLLNVAIFVGSFVSPLVLSPIAARFGYPGLYAAMASAVAVVGLARVMQLGAARAARGPVDMASILREGGGA